MYKCYLGKVRMPETPAKLTVKVKGKNTTVTLLNEGEISFLRAPGLSEITLPLTFPMLGTVHAPEYYLGLLEGLKTKRAPTWLKITRTTPDGRTLLFDTNIKVSVEEYTVTEDAKNGLDMAVDVQLKQYRDYSTKSIRLKKSATTGSTAATVTKARAADSAPKTKTYTVKKNDSLWSIAKKYYGNGARYKDIYAANKSQIKNPSRICAGQVLVIPS